MYIDTFKSPYNIKPENKDNAAGLMRLQKDMAASKEKCYPFFQSGIILSSFTRWTHKVRSFKAIGNDTTLKSLYTGTDEAQQRGLFAGEMMQNNVLEYNGKKEYVTPDMIETARAGDRYITLKKAGNYKPGERIFIVGGDLFAGGYPRAGRDFEWNEVVGQGFDIGAGDKTVILKMPLTENFFDYDTPYIFSLDRKENPYCEHAEFEGITFDGNLAIPARKQILTSCNIINGWLWASECEEIIWNDVYADHIEFDKLVKKVTGNNLRTPSSPSNGGSIYEIELNNPETGNLRLCPRYLTINKPKIWATKVIKDEEKQLYDYAIPCIADAPARNPIRRYTITEPTYLSGPESQADSNLEFAPFEEITI